MAVVKPSEWRPRGVAVILRSVAAAYGVPLSELVGPCQEHQFVVARYDCARELRKRGFSLPQIGRFLGGRHHTTIKHSLDHPPRGSRRALDLSPWDPSVPDLSGEWAI